MNVCTLIEWLENAEYNITKVHPNYVLDKTYPETALEQIRSALAVLRGDEEEQGK